MTEKVKDILDEHEDEIKDRFGVERIGLFGSCARGEKDAVDRTKQRRKDNVREAKRAREFSEEETLKMGFDMIDFAVKLNRSVKIEED